jgi:hypothetical protein
MAYPNGAGTAPLLPIRALNHNPAIQRIQPNGLAGVSCRCLFSVSLAGSLGGHAGIMAGDRSRQRPVMNGADVNQQGTKQHDMHFCSISF